MRLGRKTVPILVTEQGTYTESTEIVRWADARMDPGARIYPQEAALRKEVDECPQALREEGDAFRNTTAGAFALRMWREHRRQGLLYKGVRCVSISAMRRRASRSHTASEKTSPARSDVIERRRALCLFSEKIASIRGPA